MGGKKRDKQREIQQRRQQNKKDRQHKKQIRKRQQRGGKLDAFKLSRQYIDFYKKFDKEISVFKIKLKDVGGDGNCLFRSFADQIDGSEQAHLFMRQEACRHIMENKQFFIPFIDEDQEGTIEAYIKEMSKDGEWGGHLELQALSECFRCIMVIHKINLEQVVITPMTQRPEGGIIHLAYFQTEDFEHYLSIRDIDDQGEQPGCDKLKPLNKNMYEHLLYEDMEEYMMMKEIEELKIIDNYQKQKPEEENDEDQNQEYQQEQQPFPGYPRNKKCKCGSKIEYKNCCFKDYQKRMAQKGF